MGGLGAVLQAGTKLILLTKGKFAIIDDEDFEHINQWCWYYSNWGYAVRFEGRKSIFMHRIIAKTPKGMDTDHIDKNRLNNSKSNLRICSKRENQGNRWKPKIKTTSKYKGVSFCKQDGIFVAYGSENGKTKRLGGFEKEKDAAIAYNNWASKHFGKFAVLNPIEEILK